VSSDGLGGIGNRGDCGHIEVKPPTCTLTYVDNVLTACLGHGVCSAGGICLCNDGWWVSWTIFYSLNLK
jgi:hypothetical protein